MKFEPAQWSEEAARGLGASLGDDLAAIREQVISGSATLQRCRVSGSWMVTRIEGRELVIVCYAGRGARATFRKLHQYARAAGIESIRFHTSLPWLADLLIDWNPKPVEYVIRVAVHHG
jgi:pyrimidine operon attenuation protein/uracil phosphoribosyltransferase